MKKAIFIILFVAMAALSAFAATPKLECLKFFDGRYDNNPKVSVTKISSASEPYYMSIDVYGEPSIAKAVTNAVEKDRKKAGNVVENKRGGMYKLILNFDDTTIGYTRTSEGVKLFVTGNAVQ